jgi:hypothetical protein
MVKIREDHQDEIKKHNYTVCMMARVGEGLPLLCFGQEVKRGEREGRRGKKLIEKERGNKGVMVFGWT